MVRDKVRLRFSKIGDLRLVSHHDLMRCFERMLRRASLPYATSSGFNPRPRLVFAQSLALGIAGTDEVVELALAEPMAAADVLERLRCEAPPGLEFNSARQILPKQSAQVYRVRYRLALPAERAVDLAPRLAALLAATECWIERTRPTPKRFNLRPYLDTLTLEQSAAGAALDIDLFVTPTGSARPDEVLGLLELRDLLEAGVILERTRLELHDELPSHASDPPAAEPVQPGLSPAEPSPAAP